MCEAVERNFTTEDTESTEKGQDHFCRVDLFSVISVSSVV